MTTSYRAAVKPTIYFIGVTTSNCHTKLSLSFALLAHSWFIPPLGYDQDRQESYPVLYLYHGYGDTVYSRVWLASLVSPGCGQSKN